MLRAVLATALCTIGLVGLSPTPAHACRCAGGTTRAFVELADVVVVATVVDIEPPRPRLIMSSSDPVAYTVEVDRVLVGGAAATTRLRSAGSGVSCGLEGVEVGRSYVVFATREPAHGEQLWASLCGGTRSAPPAFVAEVERVTGPGRPPEPVESDGDGPSQEGLPVWHVVAGAAGILWAVLGFVAGGLHG